MHCNRCGVDKPADEMAEKTRCIACRSEVQREWYARTREARRAKAKAKREAGGEEQKARQREKMRRLRQNEEYRERERARDRERHMLKYHFPTEVL